MKIHELKIYPKYFNLIANGKKTFEVRYNDRNFDNGDMLIFQEYYRGKLTGRTITAYTPFVLNDINYCKEDYVILSLMVVEVRGTNHGKASSTTVLQHL